MLKKFLTLFSVGVFIITSCCNIHNNHKTCQLSNQNSKQRTPLMGWSSWNIYALDINENNILEQANNMVKKGLKDVGYEYVNIDDGYFNGRAQDGELQIDTEKFPHGLRFVADSIHKLGLKAGIYTEAGRQTCGSMWGNDKRGIEAGIYGHEKQDARLFFNDFDFDYIKIDYCGAEALNLEEQKRYTEIYNAIKETAKKDVRLNICRWAFPGVWAENIADAWRISFDITPEWDRIKYIINKNLYLSAYARNGHFNDMDMLEIGQGLSLNEEEVHFGLWCLMSSPLVIGCDMTTISEQSLNLLKNTELIALNQDVLGKQAYVVQNDNNDLHIYNKDGVSNEKDIYTPDGQVYTPKKNTYVLVKDILKLHGNTRAVALLNLADEEKQITIPLRDLDLEDVVALRELVKHVDLIGDIEKINNTGEISYSLKPHSIKVLKVEARKRLERRIYEAETAYLPCFTDVSTRSRDVKYVPSKSASGGMKVKFLGGRPENYALWDEVYSENGGEYAMTVFYVSAENKKIEVEINGERVNVPHDPKYEPEIIDSLEKDEELILPMPIRITLKPGLNQIKIGADYCWAPDIDYFTLEKI